VKVVVLTTSYPRSPGDAAGRFIADGVEQLRAADVDVEIVSPNDFRHFGIAYGSGVVGNLRQRPWLAAALPPMLASFARAGRRAARDADLVHAHWLPSGAVALATGKPFIVQLWGTDVELARRAPAVARAILRRARLVIAPSTALAEEGVRLGGRFVRVIPNGVAIPDEVGTEAEPPEVLYAGRLSPEKGVLELAQAARGLNLVMMGDGPLRSQLPQATGFVTHDELQSYYARAAVVACPSHREGFGVACAEAMAHGKPVVASAVGGLRDLVVDGETGLLVPPRDVLALREALSSLVGDRELRARLGTAARERIKEHFSWRQFVIQTKAAYGDAVASTQ
jgi:glycosyltransferase involved in cell wall biosynthesis